MKNNVIKFRSKNLAEDADDALETAKGIYEDVLMIGWDKENHMRVCATYSMSIEEMVFLIDQFKHDLLDGKYYE